MSKGKTKPGRIVAALDTESTPAALRRDGKRILRSLPVSYQIAWTKGADLATVDIDAIEPLILRDQTDIARALSPIIRHGLHNGYSPVIAVHNLAYDLHFLMSYIEMCADNGYTVTCCFKSSIKPLNVSICKGRERILTFWDTLAFSGMSLARMGEQCGRAKLLGSWDYTLNRHAQTPLTDEEISYAAGDCLTLLSWLKYWESINPEIDPGALGTMVLTKTSVVRAKCRNIAREIEIPVSRGIKNNVYDAYLNVCRRELPKTEQDYNLMIRSTSAGWSFTAADSAGITWERAFKYDAASMHPSHMVSKYYPVGFQVLEDQKKRDYLFSTICKQNVEKVIGNWVQPFEFAFNARVRFTNFRMKPGSLFERDGVALHGQGLFADYTNRFDDYDDESSNREFNAINASGYANTVINPVYSFGKLVRAESVTICLNEINAWVNAQVYTWDSFEVLEMSASANFKRPPEYVGLSVATMLERKKLVKGMRGGKVVEKPDWMPANAYDALLHDPHGDLAGEYYGLTKADLNSLYGMFATNEAKQNIAYIDDENTFEYEGERGFDNLPKKPKAWYQFGMRVAAFSRLQQACAMILLDNAGLVEKFVNGDTDSFCFQGSEACNDAAIMDALKPLHSAIDSAIAFCGRSKVYDPGVFRGLGRYEIDCKPAKYCAVANKRYAYISKEDLQVHVTSAGVPVKSVRSALEYELAQGSDFSKAVIMALGYDVTYIGDLSGTKAKSIPTWGEVLEDTYTVTDYLSNVYDYEAGTCLGISLIETNKTLGAGYLADYQQCCSNAKIPIMSPRNYERVKDESGADVIGKW